MFQSRRLSRKIFVGNVPVGGDARVSVQSMCNTDTRDAKSTVEQILALEEAGCFSLVVEKIPTALTEKVCNSLHIPVIGIGGGPADGQVLVVHDMLGMNKGFAPKFLRRYADLYTIMTDAIGQYIMDVKEGDFPNEEERY